MNPFRCLLTIILINISLFVNAQLPKEVFWGKLIKGSEVTHVKYSPDSVWRNVGRLKVYHKTMLQMQVFPFEYDEVYLDGKRLYSHIIDGKEMFLDGIILHGDAHLYFNQDNLGREWFYVKIDTMDFMRIERSNLQNFLKTHLYGKNDNCDQKIDEMILPAKMIYLRSFFEDLIYTYNTGHESPLYKDLKRKIKFNSIKGIGIGTTNGGIAIGIYSQVPISTKFRFDTELMYSSFRAKSRDRLKGILSFEEEIRFQEVQLPFGFRYIPTSYNTQVSLQSGVMARYSTLIFDALPAVNAPEKSITQLKGHIYVGFGFNQIINFRNTIGFDVKYVLSNPSRLFQLVMRMSI